MKLLFIVTNIYLPQSSGGLRTSVDQLCRGLQTKGHSVSVLAEIRHGGLRAWWWVLKMRINRLLTGHKIERDQMLGYPVWRTWFPIEEISYVASREKPDLIVIMGGKMVPAAKAARATGLPVLVQAHDVMFDLHQGDFKAIADLPCVANSNFTSEKYRQVFGADPMVVHPFIAANDYRTSTSRENVTFINPAAHKGAHIAVEIARRCPEIHFTFIEGLPLWDEHGRILKQQLATLSNVTLLPPQKNMRKIYAKCKILLVPSICEEAYGRTVTEAALSGIPAVTSNRGGLPEAVGYGGIMLDPEGRIEAWVDAVRKLWNDDTYYNAISTRALAHAERPEMAFDHQINAHEEALQAAVKRWQQSAQ